MSVTLCIVGAAVYVIVAAALSRHLYPRGKRHTDFWWWSCTWPAWLPFVGFLIVWYEWRLFATVGRLPGAFRRTGGAVVRRQEVST